MKILFFVAAFFISMTGFCQKGDYLVKNNGDTVWGSIKLVNKIFYVSGSSNSEISADEVSFIRSVNYLGNTVVHCNLLLYVDNLADLDMDYTKTGATDTVMILSEIYKSPKINLYYGKNDFKVPFYFYKTPDNSKPVQLVISYYLQGGLGNYNEDRHRYRGIQSKVMIEENKGYVNQLYAIMGDCKKITEPMWELLSYRDYSLIKMCKKYNRCN